MGVSSALRTLTKPFSPMVNALPAWFTFSDASQPEDFAAMGNKTALHNLTENTAWDAAASVPGAAIKTVRQWASPERLTPWKQAGKSILRDAKGLAGLDVAARTAFDVANTNTDDYYKRFGFDPSTADRTFAKDLGVRSLGAASDMGARVVDLFPFTDLDIRRYYRDYQE